MIYRTAALAALFLLAPASLAAQPPSHGQLKARFESVISRLDSAERTGNIDLWARILRQACTPGVQFVAFGGKPIGLDQEIAIERRQFSGPVRVLADRERLVGMTASGDSAHAVVVYNLAMQQSPNTVLHAVTLVHYTLIRHGQTYLIDKVDILSGTSTWAIGKPCIADALLTRHGYRSVPFAPAA